MALSSCEQSSETKATVQQHKADTAAATVAVAEQQHQQEEELKMKKQLRNSIARIDKELATEHANLAIAEEELKKTEKFHLLRGNHKKKEETTDKTDKVAEIKARIKKLDRKLLEDKHTLASYSK